MRKYCHAAPMFMSAASWSLFFDYAAQEDTLRRHFQYAHFAHDADALPRAMSLIYLAFIMLRSMPSAAAWPSGLR